MSGNRDVIVAGSEAARGTLARGQINLTDTARPTPFETPLLDAKFAVPTHSLPLVARPRLLERLDRGVQGPITLVSAPAGTGKTVLVSSWSASEGERSVGHLDLLAAR